MKTRHGLGGSKDVLSLQALLSTRAQGTVLWPRSSCLAFLVPALTSEVFVCSINQLGNKTFNKTLCHPRGSSEYPLTGGSLSPLKGQQLQGWPLCAEGMEFYPLIFHLSVLGLCSPLSGAV